MELSDANNRSCGPLIGLMEGSALLKGRLTAFLSEKQNRRRVTAAIAVVSLSVGCAVAVPIAMSQAACSQPDDQQVNDSKKTDPPANSDNPANATVAIPADVRKALGAALDRPDTPKEQQPRPVGPPAATSSDNASIKEPKHELSKMLLHVWRSLARSDGKIPGATVSSLAPHVEDYSIAIPKLRALLSRFDATRDWSEVDIIALLDAITDIATDGLPLNGRINQYRFSKPENIQLGHPLPPELAGVAWGSTLENGLRSAWVIAPQAREYKLGCVLETRVLIHNSGKEPVVFILPKHNMPSQANVSKGQIHEVPYARLVFYRRVRLNPGCYIEVPSFDVAVEDHFDVDKASTEAVIEAKPGDDLQLSYTVDLTEEFLRQPDGLKAPQAIRLRTIANRVAEEAPLPTSAIDRELLLRHVVLDMFGEPPTATELVEFVADKSPEALSKLTERLQLRKTAKMFVGEIPSGHTTIRIASVTPGQ